MSEAKEIRNEALFLLDRLNDLDWSRDRDEIWRDFAGHCEPSMERLKMLLEKKPTRPVNNG